jgi:hypothetical protein
MEWYALTRFPPPEKLVTLCRILNNEIYAKVTIGKHLSSEFRVNKGFRQGDAIAPLMFMKCWKLKTEDLNYKLGIVCDKCSKFVALNDDDIITMGRLQDIEEVFTSLVKETNKMGLE